MDNNIEYITQSTVIEEYGFTKSMIEKLLPEPMLKRNSRNGYAPYKLWPREVVEVVVRTEEYAVAKEKSDKRKAACAGRVSAAHLKKEQACAEVRSHYNKIFNTIDVQRVPVEAIYNACGVDASTPQNKRDRWAVNFIRHSLTRDYDYNCERLSRSKQSLNGAARTTVNDIYLDYKEAVLRKIMEVCPSLKEECDRQLGDIYMVMR